MPTMTEPDRRFVRSYVGFWPRVGAAIIDTVLLMVLTYPILIGTYGWGYFNADSFIEGPVDLFVSWILPAILIVGFWIYKQATPGKMAISARIVDARTGGRPSAGRFVIRYLGYFVSMLPPFLGIIWVAFDRRKQGWHDKLARTVVVRSTGSGIDGVATQEST